MFLVGTLSQDEIALAFHDRKYYPVTHKLGCLLSHCGVKVNLFLYGTSFAKLL